MGEDKWLLLEISNFSKYVQSRKTILGASNRVLAQKTGVSHGEISKIITEDRKSVSLHAFYNIAVNSGDTVEKARDAVYPHRSFELSKITPARKSKKSRTNFGQYMKDHYETKIIDIADDKNSFENILARTGIPEQRLKDIYFNTGAPEPYEVLLIEKAVGKAPGELMADYVKKYPVKGGSK